MKILVNIPSPTDATSFYRGVGPLSQLRNSHITITDKVDFQFTDKWNWAVMAMSDAVFMQRPFHDQHRKLLEIIQLNRKPLWVDYDDDLFSVPMSNPTFKIYGNEKTQKNVATMIAAATAVTVSTPYLKEKLLPLNKNIEVIPNAFNDHIFPLWENINFPRHKLITWRGSGTHQEDLADFIAPISDVARDYKNWTWNFIGDVPWFIQNAVPGKNLVISETIDVIEYHQFLCSIEPSIHIVPLKKTEFNKSKSNIAWIEGTYAGAACLVPEWGDWNKPGAVTYKDPQDFKVKLKQMIDGEINLSERVRTSWDYIKENLLASKVNEKRRSVISSLNRKL